MNINIMEENTKMKKTVALLFALVMAFSVCACSQPAPAEETTEETAETAAPAEETPAEKPHFDKLTLEFVPSKDADVIITGTKKPARARKGGNVQPRL